MDHWLCSTHKMPDDAKAPDKRDGANTGVASVRRTRLLYRLTVLFVAVWAIRSLAETGHDTLNEHYLTVLKTPPSVTQSMVGTGLDQSLLKIDQAIPRTARVAVIWSDPTPDYWGVFFWSTYYLYPRRVEVAPTPFPDLVSRADAIVFVRRPDQPPLAFVGFTPASSDEYPDVVVTTYRHG